MQFGIVLFRFGVRVVTEFEIVMSVVREWMCALPWSSGCAGLSPPPRRVTEAHTDHSSEARGNKILRWGINILPIKHHHVRIFSTHPPDGTERRFNRCHRTSPALSLLLSVSVFSGDESFVSLWFNGDPSAVFLSFFAFSIFVKRSQ